MENGKAECTSWYGFLMRRANEPSPLIFGHSYLIPMTTTMQLSKSIINTNNPHQRQTAPTNESIKTELKLINRASHTRR